MNIPIRKYNVLACPACNGEEIYITSFGDYVCKNCKLVGAYRDFKTITIKEYCELYDYHPWWRRLFGLGPLKRGQWVRYE